MKRIFPYILLIITLGIIGYLLNLVNNQKMLLSKYTVQDNTLISMMVENETGAYEESENNEWPSGNYILNTERSGCESGGTLEYHDDNFYVKTNSSDRCYVYFALDTPSNRCLFNYDDSLACDLIKSKDSTLIYHDGKCDNESEKNCNLEAGDFNYRYSGADKNVNNFVCLDGTTTEGPCANGNADLYRVIGLFKNSDNKYEVKLIKYDYATENQLGSEGAKNNESAATNRFDYYRGSLVNTVNYFWSTYSETTMQNGRNEWNWSNLRQENLNDYYLYSYLADKNMNVETEIADHFWKTIGYSSYEVPLKTFYNYELGIEKESSPSNPAKTEEVKNKIGLMYVSDYGYAATSDHWTANIDEYDNAIDDNWMFMGLDEWTITRNSSDAGIVFEINFMGGMVGYTPGDYIGDNVRPCFYLFADAKTASGNGSKENPYRYRL